jgi:predicted heme/steroid binding protein/uncharacterized membrane protein
MTACLSIGLLLICVLPIAVPAQATEEYARQTGQACAACHRDPAGGGELTAAGRTFQEERATRPASGPQPLGLRAFRVAVGYLHLITAILWFGTILYVHLILKPAYAVRGLPPTEVRLGRISMLIMAATGLTLAHFRIASLDMLLHSRFGLLLMIKVSLFLVMVVSAMAVVHLIGPKLRERARLPAGDAKSEAGRGDLTREELTQFDGRMGRPAYIGYAGRIYDVTRGEVWKGGVHFGRHPAGQDLTEALSRAPHTAERVLAMPLVGTLVAAMTERRRPLPERMFYVLAYVNLGLACAIIVVVALWRWG